MKINIVDNKIGEVDGFHRYSDGVFQAMKKLARDLKFEMITPTPLQVPRSILRVSKICGLDAAFVLQHNPLKLHLPKADISHMMNQNVCTPLSFSLLYKKENKNQKIVATVYDVMPLTQEYCQIKNPIEKWLYRLTIRGIKKADAIITTAECIKEDIHKSLRIERRKIHVIHGGIDTLKFHVNKLPKTPAVFQKGKINLLFVGSEIPRKNLERILTAFAKVRKKYDIHFIKIGNPLDQKRRTNLFRLIKKLNISKNVTFVEQQDKDLPHYYNAADLLVFTTLYEGFGFPPLEAMACGCPVLGSTTGSQPEVLGDAALLVNPFDVDNIARGMEQFIKETTLRKEYSIRGLKKVRQYTWKSAAQKTIEVYRKVYNQPHT